MRVFMLLHFQTYGTHPLAETLPTFTYFRVSETCLIDPPRNGPTNTRVQNFKGLGTEENCCWLLGLYELESVSFSGKLPMFLLVSGDDKAVVTEKIKKARTRSPDKSSEEPGIGNCGQVIDSADPGGVSVFSLG